MQLFRFLLQLDAAIIDFGLQSLMQHAHFLLMRHGFQVEYVIRLLQLLTAAAVPVQHARQLGELLLQRVVEPALSVRGRH